MAAVSVVSNGLFPTPSEGMATPVGVVVDIQIAKDGQPDADREADDTGTWERGAVVDIAGSRLTPIAATCGGPTAGGCPIAATCGGPTAGGCPIGVFIADAAAPSGGAATGAGHRS
eukprot:gene22790-1537_t